MRKGMWKKGLTVAMAAAMLAGPVSVPAVFNNGVAVVKADETNKGQDVYVLMNIPYADFYKAELNNTVKVDATTSATKAKTKSTLANGSYHAEIQEAFTMENKSSYQINEQGVLGEVKIADDVIAVIAGIAATEVTGVARMCGNITNELVSKLGVNNLSKGVKVVVENHHVRVNLALELDYGVSIPEISKKVQDRVKAAIENMTGLKVREVNVRVTGVAAEEE